MRPSQILAIDTVNMQAEPAHRERLIWFYRDLVGLTFDEDPANRDFLLFASARRELRIDLVHQAVVEKIRRRALISVRSLDQVADVLEEEGMPHQRVSGMTATDRRITLPDPAENRVELKHEWRAGVFAPGDVFGWGSGQKGPESADGKISQKSADKPL